jgi:hypothetical protein
MIKGDRDRVFETQLLTGNNIYHRLEYRIQLSKPTAAVAVSDYANGGLPLGCFSYGE